MDHDQRHLTGQDLAKRWSVTPGYLANLRSEGRSPIPFVKFPGRVLYRLADVEAYEEDHLVAAAA